MTFEQDLKEAVRTIPDYPKPGILFRDITTLLGDARAFRRAVDELVQPWAGSKIDKVAGIEARGFIIGGAGAHRLFARIWSRRNGDARRRHPSGPARDPGRRSDRDRRHRGGCCEIAPS